MGRNVHLPVFFLFLACFFLVLIFFHPYHSPEGEEEKIREPRVCFPEKGDLCIYAELATTQEEIREGLMRRESLGENEGMLFLFENEAFRSFWMKNMEIPLDIIWMNENRQVVYVHKDAPPCESDPCPTYSPDAPAMYVLEVCAGFSEKNGIKEGERAEFILPP